MVKSDIFLPAAVARTIPIWSSAIVVAGVLLHVHSALASTHADHANGIRLT
jgi:hypothetical protein